MQKASTGLAIGIHEKRNKNSKGWQFLSGRIQSNWFERLKESHFGEDQLRKERRIESKQKKGEEKGFLLFLVCFIFVFHLTINFVKER